MSHIGSSRDTSVAKVLERQMRNWELARAQRRTVPQVQRPEVEEFIAVSRGVATGGGEVAAHVGEQLGWPIFDKEILDLMAGDDTLRRQLYTSMDERDLGWCEEALRSLMHHEFVKNDYFRRLTETVLSIARQGHAIFLGRGCDLILPRHIGFRVRLIAPIASCVAQYAHEHDLTKDAATDEIRRIEEDRNTFIRNRYNVDPGDPTRFDLTINMERFSPSEAVELILCARKDLGLAG